MKGNSPLRTGGRSDDVGEIQKKLWWGKFGKSGCYITFPKKTYTFDVLYPL